VNTELGFASASIERRLTLPRREQHEHAFGWIHAGQSARHADRAFSFDREWIIAAGIQDEDYRRRALLLQPVGKPVCSERRVLDKPFLARVGSRHIDGEKIIRAVDGEAVAREIAERRVAGRDLAFELDQGPAYGVAADILGLHHIEAELGQFGRDGVGVVHHLLQLRDVLIGVVADDEGKTLCGLCGGGHGEERRNEGNNESEAHSAPITRMDRHAEPSLSLHIGPKLCSRSAVGKEGSGKQQP